MEFEKVKSYLSQHVDDNGTSIYSHIAAIARKIVEEKPENAYELFENLSLEVKQSKLNVDTTNDIPPILVNEEEREQIQQTIDSILTLYGRKPEKKTKKNDDAEEEEEEQEEKEEEEAIDVTKCANILEYQQLLSWSGISINYEEGYQLQHSFNRLIRKFENIENSRFWGKIQAMDNDYYIVEVKLTEYPEPDENKPAKVEDPGKGINEFVYFVTTNIENGEWIKLNDVTPEQIKKSREIHRLFTGDLNSKIGGRVHFEWSEAELLRAQIARISSSTILAPNEYYQKPEEEDEENPFIIELNEEFAPSEDGGISQESWVHSRGHLRIEGRLKKWIEPEKEDEDEEDDDDGTEKEEKEPTAEELEEEIPILQSIMNDKSDQFSNGTDDEENESSNCWYIRQLNKNTPYKIIVINNKLWNGAKTIYISNTKTFINIYIGNGIKYRSEYYTPTPPSIIQSQFNEFKEIEIPNPENEEETITKQESIFNVQKEEMPPPPPPKEENDENNDDENADKEEEAE